MRALRVLAAIVPLVAGCACPGPTPAPGPTANTFVNPFPPGRFAVPKDDPVVASLKKQEADIRANPHAASLELVCSDAFSTLIGGRYCTPRVKACCGGVDCRPADVADACTSGNRPGLTRTCCAEAAPAFFENVPSCAGMAVDVCALVAAQDGPKPIP
jgi:hypothetical protein